MNSFAAASTAAEAPRGKTMPNCFSNPPRRVTNSCRARIEAAATAKSSPKAFATTTGWWQKAAEQGHTQAQVELATQYFLGRGAPKDWKLAAKWYEAAVESGDVGAQYIIGNRRGIRNDRPIIPPYDVNDQGSGDMYPKGGEMLHTIRQVVDNDSTWRDIGMDNDSRSAAAFLRQRAHSGDTLFIWGYRPEIYVYSRLPAATVWLDRPTKPQN